MKLALMPTTKFGKISSKFLLGFFIHFGLSQISYLSSVVRTDGGEEIRNMTAAITMAVIGLVGMVSGIGAFFTGTYAFIKEKERSLLIYISLLFGLFALTFILGEIFIPH